MQGLVSVPSDTFKGRSSSQPLDGNKAIPFESLSDHVELKKFNLRKYSFKRPSDDFENIALTFPVFLTSAEYQIASLYFTDIHALYLLFLQLHAQYTAYIYFFILLFFLYFFISLPLGCHSSSSPTSISGSPLYFPS